MRKAIFIMTIKEAKELLSFHSGRNSDVNNIKWQKGFLGCLRPFDGTIRKENFFFNKDDYTTF